MGTAAASKTPIRPTIPARLDRLSWSPFHTRTVCLRGVLTAMADALRVGDHLLGWIGAAAPSADAAAVPS